MSNDTLTTATQQMVVSYGNSVQMAKYLEGQFTSPSIDGPLTVQIYQGKGRLVRVCILTTDGTLVDFYDSATSNITPPIDWLYSLDPVTGIGFYQAGVEFSSGLVAIIRGAATINVTFSVG